MLDSSFSGSRSHFSRRPTAIALREDTLKLRLDAPPPPRCEVCAIVPARDEAEHLPATLNALASQIDGNGRPFGGDRYEVILLANNCNDGSADLARRFARQRPGFNLHVVELELPPNEAYAGRARQLLADAACDRAIPRNGIIASTDGDTVVAPNWLAGIVAEIRAGADAVGGQLHLSHGERRKLAPAARRHYFNYLAYRYLLARLETSLDPREGDPLPRHYQFFGGNFAVTARAYRRAGGLPPTRSPEDVAFKHRLLRQDANIRHSLQVRAFTSGRLAGRATQGLSARLGQLADLGRTKERFFVESPQAAAARFWARGELRRLWQKRTTGTLRIENLENLARSLALPATWLRQALEAAPSFGILSERAAAAQLRQRELQTGESESPPAVLPVERAVVEVRSLLRQLSRGRSPSALAFLEGIEAISLRSPSL